MKLDKYKQAISDAYMDSNSNIFVNASAGCGKSSLLLHLLEVTPSYKDCLFLAFNKSIVEELESRCMGRAEVKTIHSKAFSTLLSNKRCRFKLSKWRDYAICKEYLVPSWKMVEDKKINGRIMNYLTYKYVQPESYPKYDVIFCDEAQDLNPLQRELILRMLKENGRLVVVGDFFQSVYGFQGCSTDSFKAFQDRPNTISLPLSLTYRCAKNIVEEARKYSPDIEALPDAPDGEVRFGTLDEVKNGDYVICRNNLPLVETFIKLLQAGKKSVILGKDYGEGLQSILSSINSLVDLKKMLEEKRKELEEKGVRNFQANEGYIALAEKVQIILVLVQSFGNVEAVKNQVNEIFGDKSDDKIILSTIHKSKGLEAERVFILGFHELIPSKYANTELALYGEKCLQFVAVTRAKKSLIFIPYELPMS